MVEFLSKLRAEFGTVDDYLADAGVDARTTHALRARYLV
jgi:hypothetical protein